MTYKKSNDRIEIYGLEDFNIVQILNCGQIFRYSIDGDTAVVYSKDKKAVIKTLNDKVVILTDDVDYFEDFFDLKTDYGKIKNQLKSDLFLQDAVEFGKGIRILNNDTYEMIVSFIISANNNIGRIKNSIEYLCSHFGENKGDYFAFPTLEELKRAKLEDFTKAGLGYRAPQLFDTIQKLKCDDVENLKKQDKEKQFNFLVSLKGIGEKVANCVLLFGLRRKDVFPVDTWINKVYNVITGSNTTDRKFITKDLTSRYGELSGYAQQYFFYYFRENKIREVD